MKLHDGWERVWANQGTYTVSRMRVPGGWLYCAKFGADTIEVTFVPLRPLLLLAEWFLWLWRRER